jgi:hypothetical protein
MRSRRDFYLKIVLAVAGLTFSVVFFDLVYGNKALAWSQCVPNGIPCPYPRTCGTSCGIDDGFYCSDSGVSCTMTDGRAGRYCNCWQYCCAECATQSCTDTPPTSPTTGSDWVNGVVWQDDNNSGTFNGKPETMGPLTTCLNTIINQGVDVDSSFYLAGTGGPNPEWMCNSTDGQRFRFAFSRNGPAVRITLTPPYGYTCADITWSYTIQCEGDWPAGCDTPVNASGSGCVVNMGKLGFGESNNIAFNVRKKVTVNNPPSASISSARTVRPGTTLPVTGTVTDPETDTTYAQRAVFYATKQSGTTWNYSSWDSTRFRVNGSVTNTFNCPANTKACITSNVTWVPTAADIGEWKLVINGYDTAGAWCTGNPSYSPYTNCGSNDVADVTVCGIAPDATGISNTYPATNQLVPNTGFTLNWDDDANFGNSCASGVNEYRVEIKKSGDSAYTYVPPLLTAAYPNNKPTSAQPLGASYLEPGQTYNWRVGIKNPESGYYYSPVFTFSTVDIPPSYDWISVNDGDVYAPDISLAFPSPFPSSNWPSSHRFFSNGMSSVFTGASSINSAYDSDALGTGIFAKGSGLSSASFIEIPFDAPSDAISLTNPQTLTPGKIYRLSSISTLLNKGTNTYHYNLSSSGVAVIYDTSSGTGDLIINSNITGPSASESIILITKKRVVIRSTVGVTPATPSTSPQLMMGIISEKDIVIESNKNKNDSTLIVEGLLAAKGQIISDRITANSAYPGVYVKYNPNFVPKLNAFTSVVLDSKIIWEE